MIDTCLVLAKRPVAGRVKTRLTPALTPIAAATLAAAALADTCAAVEASGIARRMLVVDDPDPSLDRQGWDQVAQCAGGLDLRIADAFAAHGRGATALVGMDTPQLTPHLLTGFDPERFDAAFGPAADGGFWLLALRDPAIARAAAVGIPMSQDDTGAAQLARLHDLGLRVQCLPELRDVDTVTDADEVAGACPGSRFAIAYRAVRQLAATS